MKIKHVVNGDQIGGWYCYECQFYTHNVNEAAEHDGTITEEAEKEPPDPPGWEGGFADNH